MKYIVSICLLLFAFTTLRAEEPTDTFDVTLKDVDGSKFMTPVNKILLPKVFNGYRHLSTRPRLGRFMDPKIIKKIYENLTSGDSLDSDSIIVDYTMDIIDPDIVVSEMIVDTLDAFQPDSLEIIPSKADLPIAFGSVIPEWLANSISAYRFQEDFIYNQMTHHPFEIEYAYWDLPERPELPELDDSFMGYLRRLNIPSAKKGQHLDIESDDERINWLHKFNISLQLSQAYLSGNWYQGGNSYLAFFGNFLWDVLLNQVYYPKLLFQSTVSYKMAINSAPEDKFHKYQVSVDLFQYNLKVGYKAIHNWYYSFTGLFKTQFLHNYPADSETRTASFLSPGELNLGIGMTYSKENQKKTLKLSLSLAPLSYNFKSCIDPKVDPALFGITNGHRTLNEIGSNVEVNFMAKFWGTATYTTRFFFFTDYHSFQTDWENTLNFQFSKLFSTQVYAHLRYDTQTDSSISPKWGKLMLKEILSVGLSYTFSTK